MVVIGDRSTGDSGSIGEDHAELGLERIPQGAQFRIVGGRRPGEPAQSAVVQARREIVVARAFVIRKCADQEVVTDGGVLALLQ